MFEFIFSVSALVLLVAISVGLALFFRVVVPTNEVHVVQRRKSTIPYGRGKDAGNVYYKWPQWFPIIGITTIDLPVSIFDVDLERYEAYDVGRVPFMVDVKAFFQVEHTETAAQRVEDFVQLEKQLTDILRGAVRKILASADIEEIMEGRGRFGNEFTEEVKEQLVAWGVSTVKNIEFMDIRDVGGSHVIENIMAKKKSHIEMESRVEVATNQKKAQESEIENQREVDIKAQQAEQAVGERTAEKEKMVGIAREKAAQDVQEEARITAEKDMAVKKVEQERQADIDKNVAVIAAEQDKSVKQKAAEAGLIEQEREADGILAIQSKSAEGILLVGQSEAEAKRLAEMANVTPQIELAKEIGENEGYQEYLLGVEGLKIGGIVGTAKAKAMATSDMKVIANAGDVEGGINKMMDVFSSKGGTGIGSMLEALAQTEKGQELLDRFVQGKQMKITPKA